MNTSIPSDPCPCGSGQLSSQCCRVAGGEAQTPASIPETLQLAWRHHEAGRLAEAGTLYRAILAAEPDHISTMRSLGVLASSQRDHETAIELINKAIASDPNYALCHMNLGEAYASKAQMSAKAEQDEEKQKAIESYRKAIELNPKLIRAREKLGVLLLIDEDNRAAIDVFEELREQDPENLAAWQNLGLLWARVGEFEKAVSCGKRAVELDPTNPAVYSNLANVLIKQEKYEEALENCHRALEIDRDNYAALISSGNALAAMKRFDEAIDACKRAIALKPHMSEPYGNLTNFLGRVRRTDESVTWLRQMLSLMPDNYSLYDTMLFLQHYDESLPILENKAVAKAYGHAVMAGCTPYLHAAPSAAERARRPLRVGFVSGDLRSHPVGYFMESVFGHLDHARVQPVVYSTVRGEDGVTERIRQRVTEWNSLVDMTAKASAEKIHEDRVDILIDLSGHTAKSGLPLFAWKPAPVQATWIGYFATTGMPTMDYFIGDRYTLPEGEEEQMTEKPWRLPDGYLCFSEPADVVEVGPLPMLENGHVTFGCFNKLSKVNDAVVALWARLLQRLPDAQLMLKATELNEPYNRDDITARFAAHGIAAERLILEGSTPRKEYFASYHKIDIALDPFPYNGGTTTVEALWMGVPVMVKKGDRFVAHMGEGILNNLGHPEWIAADEDAFIELACSMAADPATLAAHRAALRDEMHASPLYDAPRFTRGLEDAFEQMWQIHCDEAPADPDAAIAQNIEAATECQIAGDFDAAECLYREVLRLRPNDAEVNHNLGVLAIQRGRPTESLHYFRSAVQTEPENEERWEIYIEALLACDRTEGAKRILNQARDRGFELERIRLGARAEKASQLAPEIAALFEQFISTLDALNRNGLHEQALQVARQMLQTFPDDAHAQKAIGIALAKLRRYHEAFAPLARAATLLAGDREVPRVLGEVAALHQARHLAADLLRKGNHAASQRICAQLEAYGWRDHEVEALSREQPDTGPLITVSGASEFDAFDVMA
ncbi:O-linked N-acetylglucosamine transferase family protein [Paraburkholderia oxyphila]|uniref:O-linked N-acetylglucosamine transferase family protein n=1 Tax=Paraburkholderia oxyphila TaxID=614212 RepID=UPI000694F6A8|nr:tetratricopeptide repeat protein [Paraburkholderia oxyphila]